MGKYKIRDAKYYQNRENKRNRKLEHASINDAIRNANTVLRKIRKNRR
jgi:hypothetical protein